jgi:hypothetical protein
MNRVPSDKSKKTPLANMKEKQQTAHGTKEVKTKSDGAKVRGEELLALALKLRRNKMNSCKKSILRVSHRWAALLFFV